MKVNDCKNCPYFNGLGSLRRKFSNMKSLSDYTKQVRKEVCEEIRKNCWCGGALLEDNYYKVPVKLLDQIQGKRNERIV